MAKRLTDTNKWDKIWFRKLPLEYKCLWLYICDRCSHAGIWEVDFETANHYIGVTLNMEESKKLLHKQYIELNSGSRWFIKDFIYFQYGKVQEHNKMFNPIKNDLERHRVSIGYPYGIDTGKVKDKVKDKVIVKDKDKDKDKVRFDPHVSNLLHETVKKMKGSV
jgi:hypothetical protein